MRVKIVEVNIEQVKNGKNQYSKAEVIHMVNGQARTQKIMSFSNPAIFKQVQSMKSGEEYDVTVTKNDQGFNQWAAIERASDADGTLDLAPAEKPSKASPAVRSTYETPEERAQRQLMIVRQSSISNALVYLKDTVATDATYSTDDVLSTAQTFVDFVYGNKDTEALVDMKNDIPY